MTARRRGECGSLAIEMAIAVPSLLLLLALISAYGRVAAVNGTLESGTRDAARSATVARSHAEAQERAAAVLADAATDLPGSCRESLEVVVSEPFAAGEPVTVDATCRYTLADLGLPGGPLSLTPESSFTSMLDPNRGVS